jgi:CDP-diglyceride synthetase
LNISMKTVLGMIGGVLGTIIVVLFAAGNAEYAAIIAQLLLCMSNVLQAVNHAKENKMKECEPPST